MSVRDILVAASGSSSTTHFISSLQGTGGQLTDNLIIDAAGNSYCTGYTTSAGAGSLDILVVKYNSAGVIQWQRTLGTTNVEAGSGVEVDSSGNVYAFGFGVIVPHSNNYYAIIISKYNSSGTIQWQKYITPGNANITPLGFAMDSSGNMYCSGDTANGRLFVLKLDNNANILWQRRLEAGSTSNSIQELSLDSSGNIYICGYTPYQTAGANDLFVAKYNNSGTLQWQRRLGGTTDDYGYGVATDSSGNCYVSGYSVVNSAQVGLYAKYDTNGNIQWQRILTGTGNTNLYNINVDNVGNVYLVGQTTSLSTNNASEILIVKCNSNGEILWQRILRGPNTSSNGTCYKLIPDNNGSIYLSGAIVFESSNFYLVMAKLPDDGSKTGTYSGGGGTVTNVTYLTSSLTSSTTSLTSASATLSEGTNAFNAPGTSFYTSSTSTLTSRTRVL